MTLVRLAELRDALRSAIGREQLSGPMGGRAVVVDAHDAGDLNDDVDHARTSVESLPVVLIAVAPGRELDDEIGELFDVVVDSVEAARHVTDAVDTNPIAATALALLLRSGQDRSVAAGLVAESSTYSLLQAGPEHAAWLASRAPRPDRTRDVDEAPVRVEREGARLSITLARPQVRNAYNAAMRDALLEALAMAAVDDSITDVVVRGDGPSFCSGGDLDEFGTLADPASAHLLRLARSVAWSIHTLADRVTVEVHGACIGAGIELPAFAHHVTAAPDARFALPEVTMGLVPGAGGTVSLPRRIGRQRTAWLALTGQPIDAPTALSWGLIDEIRTP